MAELSTQEFMDGGRHLKLDSGETIFLRMLKLRDLEVMAGEVWEIVKDISPTAVAAATSGAQMFGKLCQLPGLLGRLCDRDMDWVKDQRLSDLLLIAEAVAETNRLEDLIPRFFGLYQRLKSSVGQLKPLK